MGANRTASILLLLGLTAFGPALAAGFSAHWEGVLSLPGNDVPIVIDLKQDEAGAWQGEIDIASQGIRNLALTGVTVDGATVMFGMDGIPGNPVFRGNLAEDGGAVTGSFVQRGQVMPFSLDRKGEPRFGHVADDGVRLVETGTPGQGPVGEWHGVLAAGPSRLRLIVHIARQDDGTLTATLDSVDQRQNGIPVDEVLWDPEAGDVGLDLGRLGAGYVGRLNADGSELVGDWEQGPASLPLTFKRR